MSDTFRQSYRQLSVVEQAQIVAIKSKAAELEAILLSEEQGLDMAFGQGAPLPAMTLARQRLSECVFWAIHAITK